MKISQKTIDAVEAAEKMDAEYKKRMEGPENDLQISVYIHCGKCLDEYNKDDNIKCSPADYSQISAGWTRRGIQLWCRRHNCNIVHIDFEGEKHPANCRAKVTSCS